MLTKAALSVETLAAVLEQSADCVKLLGLDGVVKWMNYAGQCAMEVGNLSEVIDKKWSDLWPLEAGDLIESALVKAVTGNVARFDAFCPTKKGSPRWWNVTVSRVEDADKHSVGFLAISRDVTERVVAQKAAEIIADEMRHRIKNTYAMIGGLLAGFARGNPECEIFAHDMQNRLVAISKAQMLFSSHEASCNVAELVPALVLPFDSATCDVTVSPFADILVDQGRADAIALVLGELAVNASKHGALSAGGSVRVDVGKDAGSIKIVWLEQSVKPVGSKQRDGGQGLKLIDRIIAARGGTFDIDWQESGLSATLEFPLGNE